MEVCLTYPDVPPFRVPDDRLMGVYDVPRVESVAPALQLITGGLNQPVGSLPLRERVRQGQKVLILVDDYTRATPVDLILPLLLDDLACGGVREQDVRLMVAQGTHRPMTEGEKRRRYGEEVVDRYKVLDHRWNDPAALQYLGTTPLGTEIWVNEEVLAADVVVGVGHIVPHRGAGFSGGAKIIQPGVCGPITTGQTHWLAARYPVGEMLGTIDNPPRQEMTEVARRAGLDFIVNAVQDGGGQLVRLVAGDPDLAYRAGAEESRRIYGVQVSAQTDIVIVEATPSDMDFWQSSKALAAAGLVVKQGGAIILVSPCSEGVYPGHSDVVLELGCKSYSEMDEKVRAGEAPDLLVAACLTWAGSVAPGRATCLLVSDGLTQEEVGRIGYMKAASVQQALDAAFDIVGSTATIAVLRHGTEILPIVR